MRVVREYEVSLSAALNLTVNCKKLGIRGVHLHISRDTSGDFAVSKVGGIGSEFAYLLKMFTAGEQASGEYVQCGFPLICETALFSWTGAGVREGRLVFVDEPVRPYGSAVIRKGTPTLTAGQTAIQFNLTPFGIGSKLRLYLKADRAVQANFSPIFRDVTVQMDKYIDLQDAAGGFGVGADIVGCCAGALTLVNNDGANSANCAWALVFDLG